MRLFITLLTVASVFGAETVPGVGAPGESLGWGKTTAVNTTYQVRTNIVAMSSEDNWGLQIDSDGNLFTWGSNGFGQQNVPAGATNIVEGVAGWRSGAVIRADGRIFEWGVSDTSWPGLTPTNLNAVRIAAGDFHTTALLNDNSILCWGTRNLATNANNDGVWVTGASTATTYASLQGQITDIACGWYNNLVLLTNGTVAVWGGAPDHGQSSTVPTGATNVVRVAAGPFHNIVLRGDGTVLAWGLNESGQTNIPADWTNIALISGARDNTIAVTSNGVVKIIGGNSFGQTNIPASATNVNWLPTKGFRTIGVIKNGEDAPEDPPPPPPENFRWYVATTGSDSNAGTQSEPFLTIQHAVNTAQQGSTIFVGAGTYDESVSWSSANSGGSGTNRIVLDGQGVATMRRPSIDKPYWTIQNLTVTYAPPDDFSALVYVRLGAHNTALSNLFVNGSGSQYLDGIAFETGSGAFNTNSPADCLAINNVITGVGGAAGVTLAGYRNQFIGGVITNLRQADGLRLFGQSNIFRANIISNIVTDTNVTANHIDGMQVFGDNGNGSIGHLVEGNIFSDIQNGQLCQFTQTNGNYIYSESYTIGGFRIINNIFENISLQASTTIPDTQWLNNVFYKVGGGHVLSWGGWNSKPESIRGSSEGARAINNVFLECGTPASNISGWYSVATVTNYVADYNYVGKLGYIPAREECPPSTFRWCEANGINGGNPGFVDELNGDFRLLAGSILIDTGTPLTSVTNDFESAIRPIGNGYDIGAFEFEASGGSAPVAPSGLIATTVSTSQIDLSWTDNSNNELGFRVERSQGNNTEWVLAGTVAANVTTFNSSELPPATTHFYRVLAFNSDGDSAWSNEDSATTSATVASPRRHSPRRATTSPGTPPAPDPEPDGPTVYVRPTGNDTTGDGSTNAPYRTIQKGVSVAASGYIVDVGAGSYGEYVQTHSAGVTIRGSSSTNRAFRFMHPNCTLKGFTLTGAQNIWISHVRVEVAAHNTTVTNCFFGPGVFGIADDLVFDSTNETLTSASLDFEDLGFVVNGRVFTGGSGLEEYWYANHDKGWIITSVSGGTMGLQGTWQAETNGAAWAPVYAGQNSAGIEGINFVVGSNSAATNCTFSNNTFSNLFGAPITLQGYGHQVFGNTFTKLNSYYGIRPNGGGHNIYSNLWYNSTNFLNYSAAELAAIPHPMGPSWYDYQVGFIHASGAQTAGATNVNFWRNWIEGIDNELGQINELGNAYGFLIRSNVFIGSKGPLSGGRNGLVSDQNTFYRVNFDSGAAALTWGGNTALIPSTNIAILRNAFVDVGNHSTTNTEGFYSLQNNTGGGADTNFIASPETMNWSGKATFTETNGINGGDPVLRDPSNPRGADGLPFTADDGLRPLPNSPLAVHSLGALEAVTVTANQPIAYFTITSLSGGFGWYDDTGTDFDPTWDDDPPYDRPGKVRPYTTAEAIGTAPVTIILSATNSISAINGSTNYVGLTGYRWNFDGTIVSTVVPRATNQFSASGTKAITLTVTNSAGNTASISKSYRVK